MKMHQRAALCAVIALSTSTPSLAGGYQHLLSPVVTHTNGMRLASSTSTRSHNVYWQCDPGHVGYCDGQYHTPCSREWQKLGTRHCGRFVPPYTPGAAETHTAHSMDGLEQGTGESLGLITANINGAAPAAAGSVRVAIPQASLPAAQATPPAEGNWLDAIKTLGNKIAGPES